MRIISTLSRQQSSGWLRTKYEEKQKTKELWLVVQLVGGEGSVDAEMMGGGTWILEVEKT